MTYTSKPITIAAYILAVPLVFLGFFVALGCGITYFVQDQYRAFRSRCRTQKPKNLDVVNHSTSSDAKVTHSCWMLACAMAAILFLCNGCFIIAGTGNVKVDGGIEQTGTKEAWTAFGEAAGVAGGTAAKAMIKP